jgi:hypothetical protein
MKVWLVMLFLSVGCFAFRQPPDTITFLSANTAKGNKSAPTPKDTSDIQKNKPKKLEHKHKVKEHKSAEEEMGPRILDTLRRMIDMPLLRQKDSSQNISQ